MSSPRNALVAHNTQRTHRLWIQIRIWFLFMGIFWSAIQTLQIPKLDVILGRHFSVSARVRPLSAHYQMSHMFQ